MVQALEISASPKVAGTTTLWKITGWVDACRNHGKLVFIDLRDNQYNKLQCVLRKDLATNLSAEDVVVLEGKVVARPEKLVNPKMLTGTVEFVVEKLEILNKCDELPIPINSDGKEIGEDKRLRYRYLDLRRQRLQKNIRTRSKMMAKVNETMDRLGFINIETPILTASTKEGARDFVVPSRFHKGKVYALPQSPQQYKQLLMTAGFEKYYQVARCVRDEALRADRGFEFTQLDLEMAFACESSVMHAVEEVVRAVMYGLGIWTYEKERALDHWKYVDVPNEPGYSDMTRYPFLGDGNTTPGFAFPVLTYKESMEKYGTDKPDIRSVAEKAAGELKFCWVVRFPMFKPVKEDVDKLDSRSAWTFMHNPFSLPIKEHQAQHLAGIDPGEIEAYQYDLVCNGLEIGSGSIRAHTRQMLEATFKVMGYSQKEIEESVGHMLEAFDLGTPPHGGIALGLDRLAMLVCGEESMKEVVAFPMTSSGKTSCMDGPTLITQEQMNELGISFSSESSFNHPCM